LHGGQVLHRPAVDGPDPECALGHGESLLAARGESRDPGARGRPLAGAASRERPPAKVCDENPLADFPGDGRPVSIQRGGLSDGVQRRVVRDGRGGAPPRPPAPALSVFSALRAGSESGTTLATTSAPSASSAWCRGSPPAERGARDRATVMGQEISMPVLISPTGVQAVHPDGELAVARAAAAAGTAIGLSSFASKPLEQVVRGDPKTFFQVYWLGSRERIEGVFEAGPCGDLLERLRGEGAEPDRGARRSCRPRHRELAVGMDSLHAVGEISTGIEISCPINRRRDLARPASAGGDPRHQAELAEGADVVGERRPRLGAGAERREDRGGRRRRARRRASSTVSNHSPLDAIAQASALDRDGPAVARKSAERVLVADFAAGARARAAPASGRPRAPGSRRPRRAREQALAVASAHSDRGRRAAGR